MWESVCERVRETSGERRAERDERRPERKSRSLKLLCSCGTKVDEEGRKERGKIKLNERERERERWGVYVGAVFKTKSPSFGPRPRTRRAEPGRRHAARKTNLEERKERQKQ